MHRSYQHHHHHHHHHPPSDLSVGLQRMQSLASSAMPSTSLNLAMELGGGGGETEGSPAYVNSGTPPVQLEFLPLRPTAQRPQFSWTQCSSESGSALRGIDMNQMPWSSESEEEDTDMAAPSLRLSVRISEQDKQDYYSERAEVAKANSDAEQYMERMRQEALFQGSDEEDGVGSVRKKLRLSKEQSAVLEESFKEHSTLNPKQKNALAKQLNLRPRQVEVWFQNRRARTKLKQTEVDCKLLKRCCESLTEENRRLQKEVAELRAMKVGASACTVSHDFYMNRAVPAAATLTMCPCCEQLATPHSSLTPGTSSSSGGTLTSNTANFPLIQKPYFPLSFSPQQQSSAAC